jgi:F420-dependent oxidoreductase-like protein
MIEIALMIEGQDGLNWPRWQKLVQLAEDLGFAGLYRSDHYTNAEGPYLDSLELWVSLTWLAAHTRRIQFGPLVTPVSFRQPTMTARMASAVDDLSGGRLVLGLGAGWQEREHANYGWDLLDTQARFARFEEGLRIITHLLQSEKPLDFDGVYYKLHDAVLLPRPARAGGPPILIGGNGPKRTLPLAARYAQEWNAVYTPPSQFQELSRTLDALLAEQGRTPGEVRRSLMTGIVFAASAAEVRRKVDLRTKNRRTPDELRKKGVVVGVAEEVQQQLAALQAAGVQRVMLQWLDMDDVEGIEALAKAALT